MPPALEADKAFILNPAEWPHWPVLPVVRRDGNPLANGGRAGLVLANEVGKNEAKVHVGNLFSLPSGNLSDLLKDWPVEEFTDFEGLVDVWRVD